MKLCIPVLDISGLDSKLFGHFATAPAYAIYKLESSGLLFVANSNPPTAGRVLADVVSKARVDAVLCKGMGLKGVDELAAAGIQALLVDAATVAEAVDKYRKGSVRRLEPTTPV